MIVWVRGCTAAFLLFIGIFLLQDGRRPCVSPAGELFPDCDSWELYSEPIGGNLGNPARVRLKFTPQRTGELLAVVRGGETAPLFALHGRREGLALSSKAGPGFYPAQRPGGAWHLSLLQRDRLFHVMLRPEDSDRTMIVKMTLPERPSSPFYLLCFRQNCTLTGLEAACVRYSPLLLILGGAAVLFWLGCEEYVFLRRTWKTENDPASRRLKTAASLIVCGLFAALAVVLFHRCCGRTGYPYGTYLYWPEVRFGDFYDVFARVSPKLNVYLPDVRGGNYFPLIYCLLVPFSLLAQTDALLLYLLLGAAFYLLFPYCAFSISGGRRVWLAVLLCAAYPVQFAIDRGNLELIVYALVALFAFSYDRKHYTAAALLLAMAINCKLYPGVLGVLFLADRRWREAALTALFSLLIFLGSFAVVRGSLPLLLENLRQFNAFSSASYNGISFNHTLYGAARALGLGLFGFPAERGGELQGVFTAAAVVIFSAVAAAVVFRVRAYWKRLFLLIGCFLLLPHFSFDYTLMHLLIPLLFFIFRGGGSRYDALWTAGFVLLLIPLNFYQFSCYPEIRIAVIVKPLLLAAMMCGLILSEQRAGETAYPPERSPDSQNG